MHTLNGKIRMKKSTRAAGQIIDPEEKDAGIGKWLNITSPGDLFQYEIELNFKKLNYKPLLFNYAEMRNHSLIENSY